MAMITRGHYTAYIDVYSEGDAMIEITMNTKLCTDGKEDGWDDELAGELKQLRKDVKDYVAYAKKLRAEEAAYAV